MPFNLIPIDPVEVLGQYLEPRLNPDSPYAPGNNPTKPPDRNDPYWKRALWWRPDSRVKDYRTVRNTAPSFHLLAMDGIKTGRFSTRTTVCHRVDCYFYAGSDQDRRTLDTRVVMELDREGSWAVKGMRLPKLLTQPDLDYGDDAAFNSDGSLALDMDRSYAATIFSVTFGLQTDIRPFSRVTHTSMPVDVQSEPSPRSIFRSFTVDFAKYYRQEVEIVTPARSVTAGAELALEAEIVLPDDSTIEWTATGGVFRFEPDPDLVDLLNPTWTAPGSAGEHTLTLTVTTTHGFRSVDQITVTVQP